MAHMNGPPVRRRIRVEIPRARAISLDSDDVPVTVRGKRNGEQPDAGVQVGDPSLRHLRDHATDHLRQHVSIALKKRFDVMGQRHRAV
jgi:hypothetical protein